MFFVTELILYGIDGIGSRFHVLRSRTHFRRFRGRRVSFSCYASPYSFSAVASGPVFMFRAPGLIFDISEGVGSRFHVFRPRTRFWLYRGRQVPFSCFAHPDPFSAISRASSPVFMFSALEFIFGGNDGVRSRFHVLRSRTHFRWCGGRRVPFSRFARHNSFLTVPTTPGPVFIFCAPGLVFGVPRGSGPVFMFCAPGHIFGGSKGVGSHLNVLNPRTRFRR
jgi:hypothetical protein